MAKRVLLCLSHSIEEFDQLKLLSGLGYEVASIGGYIDPAHPHDDKRPALPGVRCRAQVKEAVDALGTDDNFGAAQSRVPEDVLEWLGADGVIIFHHYLDRLFGQWDHLAGWRAAGGRVIWRTVGQSVEHNERQAGPYRRDGLEIVRYSPKERAIPGYAGEDALIRFYKDPAEWHGWTGERAVVTNVTQSLIHRHPWTNAEFFFRATEGIPTETAGPGSESVPGGLGPVSTELMQDVLRRSRCYLYTGTQPASYTLGLVEAMMTGTPVVSIGPGHMQIFPYGHLLFEGHEIAPLYADDAAEAAGTLLALLDDQDWSQSISELQRRRAIALFGVDAVGRAWDEYLGGA